MDSQLLWQIVNQVQIHPRRHCEGFARSNPRIQKNRLPRLTKGQGLAMTAWVAILLWLATIPRFHTNSHNDKFFYFIFDLLKSRFVN